MGKNFQKFTVSQAWFWMTLSFIVRVKLSIHQKILDFKTVKKQLRRQNFVNISIIYIFTQY